MHQYIFFRPFPPVCLILVSSFLVVVVSLAFSFVTCDQLLFKVGLFFVAPAGDEMSVAIEPLELFVKVNGDNVLLFFWSNMFIQPGIE